MKRNLILVGVFGLIFSLLMITSCTCYIKEGALRDCLKVDTLRGCGYYCEEVCSDRRELITVVGQIGIDHSDPVVSYIDYDNNKVYVLIETFGEYQWTVRGEVLLFQGHTLVGTAAFTAFCEESGMHEIEKTFSWNDFYDPANGEITGVVNDYSVTRKGYV